MKNISEIKSYIINLEKDKDKYNDSINNLNRINIKPERFDAIYINESNNDYIKNITYPSVQYNIKHGRNNHNNIGTNGAIGCYLSHIKLWKMLLQSNEDMFLIFEDDVNVNSSKDDINNFLNNMNNYDWDFIFLGYMKPFSNNDTRVTTNVYKINSINFGTHSYIINKKGATKLLKYAIPIVDQIDSYISYMASTRNLNAYRPDINYFVQNIIGTSIQTDLSIKPYITDMSNIVILTILLTIFIVILVLTYIIIVNKNCFLSIFNSYFSSVKPIKNISYI